MHSKLIRIKQDQLVLLNFYRQTCCRSLQNGKKIQSPQITYIICSNCSYNIKKPTIELLELEEIWWKRIKKYEGEPRPMTNNGSKQVAALNVCSIEYAYCLQLFEKHFTTIFKDINTRSSEEYMQHGKCTRKRTSLMTELQSDFFISISKPAKSWSFSLPIQARSCTLPNHLLLIAPATIKIKTQDWKLSLQSSVQTCAKLSRNCLVTKQQ